MLQDVQTNPKRILTDIYWSQYSNVIAQLINASSEFSSQEIGLNDLQEYLYSLLIPYLRKSLRDMSFSYDRDFYPCLLEVEYEGVVLGYVNIFEHTFIMAPFVELEEAQTELVRLASSLDEISQRLSVCEGYQRNIFSMAKNPLQKVDILIRSKQYKQSIIQESAEVLNEAIEAEKQIISQKVTISKLEEYYIPLEEQQRLVARYFRKNYAYQIIDKTGENNNDTAGL